MQSSLLLGFPCSLFPKVKHWSLMPKGTVLGDGVKPIRNGRVILWRALKRSYGNSCGNLELVLGRGRMCDQGWLHVSGRDLLPSACVPPAI